MSDPFRARVRAEISIYDALAAIEYFASNCPADRIAPEYTSRLQAAAVTLEERRVQHLQEQSQSEPVKILSMAEAREVMGLPLAENTAAPEELMPISFSTRLPRAVVDAIKNKGAVPFSVGGCFSGREEESFHGSVMCDGPT